jgi:hypothetical protein
MELHFDTLQARLGRCFPFDDFAISHWERGAGLANPLYVIEWVEVYKTAGRLQWDRGR